MLHAMPGIEDERRIGLPGLAGEADQGFLHFRAFEVNAARHLEAERRYARACAHESPRTTKLYDRTKQRLTQDEVERIRL
jgi:hypothetical protein